MSVLEETIELRQQIRRLIQSVKKPTIINAMKVAVESPSFDPETGVIMAMTHTPISGTEVYTTKVDLKKRTVRCTCSGGGFGRICKHTIRLARWLDERLEMDQKAIEFAIRNSVVGAHQANTIKNKRAS